MSLADQPMEDGVGMLLDMHGEEITYRPLAVGSSDKTIMAVVFYEDLEQVMRGNAVHEGKFLRIKISGRDNTEGHTSPALYILDGQGDQVLFPTGHKLYNGGQPWYVIDRQGELSGGLYTLMLSTKVIRRR